LHIEEEEDNVMDSLIKVITVIAIISAAALWLIALIHNVNGQPQQQSTGQPPVNTGHENTTTPAQIIDALKKAGDFPVYWNNNNNNNGTGVIIAYGPTISNNITAGQTEKLAELFGYRTFVYQVSDDRNDLIIVFVEED
jgi:hypothetical protein